jgi:hypothetical protein
VRFITLMALVFMILLFTAAGEIFATIALYQQRAPQIAPFAVLSATIFLTVVVLVGVPMLAFNRAVRDDTLPWELRRLARQAARDEYLARRAATEHPGEQHHDAEGST